MNGQTAKLLRKAANGNKEKYKLLKSLYPTLPAGKRAEAKRLGGELAEYHRQHRELTKMTLNPPIQVAEKPAKIVYEPGMTNKQRHQMRRARRAYLKEKELGLE